MSKRNLTIVLDDDTARWIRVEAARSDKSVSQYVGELLAERRSRSEGYGAARRAYLSREPRPLRTTATPLPTREALHARSEHGA